MTDSLLEKQEATSAQRSQLNPSEIEQIATLKGEGMAMMQGNRLQEARELFSNIVGMNPEDVDAWYMLSTITGKGCYDSTFRKKQIYHCTLKQR